MKFNEIIKDLIKTNEKVFKKTIKTFLANPILFVIGLVYMAIYYVAIMGASLFGPFASLIIFLILAAVASDYLHIINQIIHFRKVDMEDFKVGFKVYFRKVYAFMFLYWVVQMGVNLFLTPVFVAMNALYIVFSINIFLLILFNAIPEVIYQKYYSEAETLQFSLEFIKENVIDWLLPNALLFGMLYVINTQLMSMLGFLSFSLIGTLISIVLTSGILGFGMIYRGYLFEILSSSTRKKRIFTYNMYRN